MFASPQLIATVERGELWTDGLLNVTPSAVLSVSHPHQQHRGVVLRVLLGHRLRPRHVLPHRPRTACRSAPSSRSPASTASRGRLFDFVVAHGCVELSCICIAGAAGAYLGEALIRPGERTRSEAFRAAAARRHPRDGRGHAAAVHLRLHRRVRVAGSRGAALGARHHRRGLLAVHDLAAARLRVRPQPRRPAIVA